MMKRRLRAATLTLLLTSAATRAEADMVAASRPTSSCVYVRSNLARSGTVVCSTLLLALTEKVKVTMMATACARPAAELTFSLPLNKKLRY